MKGSSGITFPLQDKKLYYREQFTLANGETVLGRVKVFDLATDWMELSQDSQIWNHAGRENIEPSSPYSYNGMTYTVTVVANKTSPGFTYPKFIDCQVGSNPNDGCHLGPYIMFNELHEAKVRAMVHSAAQAHINLRV